MVEFHHLRKALVKWRQVFQLKLQGFPFLLRACSDFWIVKRSWSWLNAPSTAFFYKSFENNSARLVFELVLVEQKSDVIDILPSVPVAYWLLKQSSQFFCDQLLDRESLDSNIGVGQMQLLKRVDLVAKCYLDK